MAGDRLQDAVDLLQKFFEKPLQADVAASMLSPLPEGTPRKTDFRSIIMKSILDVARGSKSALAIDEAIVALTKGDNATPKSEIDKIIKIFVDGAKLDPKNKISDIVGKNAEGLSLIQIDTIRITPAGRLVDATAMFLNMIPTLELSRAVPYLTIEVQTKRSPISNDGKAQGMSLVRFLQGALDVSSSPVDKNLLLALQTDLDGNRLEGVMTSGMELFTSPQTLVDPSTEIDKRRSTAAIDKFRPFMSIDRLSVEVEPQVGFFSYRTANLELTLHDRSRLNEIADFIRPDLYKDTELMLEYGWSHPDASGDNAYGLFLNAMRVREKYGVVNSSFSFTQSGEVKIKLRLFTKGYTDTQLVSIGDGVDEVIAARKGLEELQRVITEIRLKVLKEDTSRSTKEIRGEQQLFAHSDDLGATLTLDKDAAAAVKNFIRKTGDKKLSGDMRTLHDSLLDLYGENGKGGKKISAIKETVATNINKKIAQINTNTPKSDPFLNVAVTELNAIAKTAALKDLSISTKGHVSFGRLMALFVGQPLAALKKYESVQLIFYPFNAKAGAASNLNVAEFPISIEDLSKGLKAIGVQQGLQIPLKDFIQYIMNNFIDDMSNHAYGLGNSYRSTIDAVTGVRKPPSNSKEVDDTKRFNAVQNRLKKLNVQDGVFKMPQLDIIIETVPLDITAVGQSAKTESTKTVLKFHFFDRCATAYESLGQLILASRENTINALGNVNDLGKKDHTTVYNTYLDLARSADIITPVNAKDVKDVKVFDVKYDYEKLKTFIRQNMPSIVYGANNTGIMDASFSTIQEPKLSTIHMRRAGEQGSLSPSGLTKANLPLRTLPAQVSMTTIGCPLIHYMQQFFIDFGTNTTVDNIYGVNKLSHELSPGKFSSKIDLIPLDAYGRYESLATQVGAAIIKIEQAIESEDKAKKKTEVQAKTTSK